MFIFKTLKNAPTCFDLIQIIFREFICSLLKLLILKFVKNVKVNVVMRQHDIWCVYVRSVWRCVPDCYDCLYMLPHTIVITWTHLHTESTYTHQMLCCRISTLTFTFLTNFKIGNFNKEHMSSLKMIWIRSKHVGAFLSVLMWTF